MKIVKTSGAEIRSQAQHAPIRIVETVNPETIIVTMLREYIKQVDFAKVLPNFKSVRIGVVHPFAMLLFQDTMGVKTDLSVFPAITVADSNDSEHDATLGRDRSEVLLDLQDVAELEGSQQADRLIVSLENLQRIKAQIIDTGKPVLGIHYMYKAYHTLDINIWADNKDVVSILYDVVKHFLVDNTIALHKAGIDIGGSIGGRRTGDINVEFGALLYGANVTVQAVVKTGSMTVDLLTSEINHIGVHDTISHFHSAGG